MTIIKAWRDTIKRPLRSLLTLIGIIIGVAGVTSIVSMSNNLAVAQEYAYHNNSEADFYWWVWDTPPSFANAVKSIPNVKAVDLSASYYTKWQIGPAWRDVQFIGINDFNNQQVNRVDLVEGNWPARGECVVEISVKEIASVHVGDIINFRSGNVDTIKHLRISGFTRSPTYAAAKILNSSIIYANDQEVRKMLGTSGDNSLHVRVNDWSLRDETSHAIQQLFITRNIDHGNLSLRDPINYPGKRELDAIILLMLVFSGLGLIISGFLVANTLSAMIGEQIGEIGAMKAIGGTSMQILRIYLYVALLYGITGTILGLIAGLYGGFVLVSYVGGYLNLAITASNFVIPPVALLLGGGIGLGVTILAALIPAWRGTTISVQRALQAYGISATYGQGIIDRLIQRISRLPRLLAFSLRNLARRKTRNTITLTVIILFTATFLAAEATNDTVVGSINHVYSVYNSDAWLWFDQPVSLNLANSLRTIPQVAQVEPWSNDRAYLGDTRTAVWGMPSDTHLYLYQTRMVEGRWYYAGEEDAVVLSTSLAKIRGAHTGDFIPVSIDKTTITLHVVGLIDDNSVWLGSTLTGKLFMPLETLNRLIHNEGTVDFFAIRLYDQQPAVVEQTIGAIAHKYHDLHPQLLATYSDKQSSLEASKILTFLLFAMVIIVALIGALGVANTLTLTILERRREIGVIRAIGGRNMHLVQVFLSEGVYLGLAGYLIGSIVGYFLARAFVGQLSAVLFPLDFTFTPQALLLTLVFVIVLTVGASVGPSLGAARLRIKDALRYG